MNYEIFAGEDDQGRRFDRVLRKFLPAVPLSGIHRLIRTGRARLNGRKVGGDARVSGGDRIVLPGGLAGAPAGTADRQPQGEASPSQAGGRRLSVVWEDEGLLFINKEPGVLMHGDGGLDGMVQDYLRGRLEPSLSFRSGPLHRLDRNTSGIVTFSKSIEGARRFSAALTEKRIAKNYLAVLEGTLGAAEDWTDKLLRDTDRRVTGVVDDGEGRDPVDARARMAVAAATPLTRGSGTTLVLVRLGTGLTHQIRVQAAARGRPLAGDVKYGGKPLRELRGTYLLHAYELSLPPDLAPSAPRSLVAPLPPRFLDFVRRSYGDGVHEVLSSAPPTGALLNAILT